MNPDPLAGLNFNGPENTCQSLRILAELARRGEVRVFESDVKGALLSLFLEMKVQQK